jgi:hypothetical protein
MWGTCGWGGNRVISAAIIMGAEGSPEAESPLTNTEH